jgi:type IV pilus assembly protein PilA
MVSSLMSRLNDRRDAAADLGEDAGFTLIELMVVLLILAILLAIAIPTFLGVTGGANDRAAQSNLNTSLTTAKSAETQNGQSYNTTGGGSTNIDYTVLSANEPSIVFTNIAVVAAGPVSVYPSVDGNGIVLASFSKSTNTCWLAVDNIAPVTVTGNGLYITANSGGSGTSYPTKAGDFYGSEKAPSGTVTTCAANPATFQATAVVTWGSTFTQA